MTSHAVTPFRDFFRQATGFSEPYGWQALIAEEGLPEVLPVPTGLGKTEVVVAVREVRRSVASPLRTISTSSILWPSTRRLERSGAHDRCRGVGVRVRRSGFSAQRAVDQERQASERRAHSQIHVPACALVSRIVRDRRASGA